MKPSRDPRVDTYIGRSASFAQPILRHWRKLVHQACPTVEETIKWNMPFFMQNGMLCGMAAFKAHAAFGFRRQHEALILGTDRTARSAAMGSLGRITRRADLPSDQKMLGFIRHAAALNASGSSIRVATKPAKSVTTVVPADLKNALGKDRAAAKAFAAFSPSHRREYVEWITEAKRPATRQKRLATTMDWLRAGKSRNWQYKSR